MPWFSKQKKLKSKEATPSAPPAPAAKGEGIWYKCEGCDEVVPRAEYERNWNVCPSCGAHDALPVKRRFELVLDKGSFQELDADLTPQDPLGFTDAKKYRDRLKSTFKSSGLRDAFVSGVGAIGGQQVSIGSFAFEFMGGSMGSVVGEKVARVFDRAYERRIPAIVFSSTGGARMQEGIFSLMQMAKTSAALHRFRSVRKPYVSVMLHPTTGGVAASFAWLGDFVIAEPKALIGFAGPRVIEQTIREKLPPGFQRSEFLLEHGMIDAIVPRLELRERLVQILALTA
ncbi:acetyl-CoA carboxylase, carboxyltransferase subunit beta [Anaeromyxobacter oryzae]|uniref:Acetyl-coenzyme A carboxylase carboxyl transferase subunit beta n=1 Tax=Anaeromyxobacter oryzae TaxID=2918170 RepID=A0ABN6N2B5_9BACT|nr:acetyl-CoA carboxylase, carboxyltransferase subunit beta [Anaeromyxobacter oryzae]BDG06165.1 acetyl-coenzyme A carboxylase carboxyl transferase subunit beta [Anaeromyxobacter oryzae]